MNELKNLDAMLDNLDNALSNVELDNLDEALETSAAVNLWKGEIECHLIDRIIDDYGIYLVFADKHNKPMPSFFKQEKFGKVYIGKTPEDYKNAFLTFKYALHLPSDMSLKDVKKHMEINNCRIYFYAQGRMGKKGMYYRSEIDYDKTMSL